MFQKLLKYIVPQKSSIREISDISNSIFDKEREQRLKEKYPDGSLEKFCEVLYTALLEVAANGKYECTETYLDLYKDKLISNNKELILYKENEFTNKMYRKYDIIVKISSHLKNMHFYW